MEELELIKWLAANFISDLRHKDGIYAYYWCLKNDAENAWDMYDSTLKWYTHEEVLVMYKSNELPFKYPKIKGVEGFDGYNG